MLSLDIELNLHEVPGDGTPCTRCGVMLSGTMWVVVVQQGALTNDPRFAGTMPKLCRECKGLADITATD
jgi:hypothetical protein